MAIMSALALLAIAVVVGGLVLAFGAAVRIVFWRYPSRSLFANRGELMAMSAAIGAAIIGYVLLFTLPAYSGSSGGASSSISSSGVTVTPVVTTKHSKTFLEVNGPDAIPFFTVPIVFALLPFAFFRLRARPIIEGLCASVLGVQAFVGMSGYGLFFAPSGALTLVAGALAIWPHMPHNNAFERDAAKSARRPST